MRPLAIIVCFLQLTCTTFAQAADDMSDTQFLNYSLGGSIEETSISNAVIAPFPEMIGPNIQRVETIEPRFVFRERETLQDTFVGRFSLFKDERRLDGRDGFLVGTALTRGSTTAGISMSVEGEAGSFERSDIFLDYALSEALSVGVSGTMGLDSELQNGSGSSTLGLNASFSRGGTLVQGSIANRVDAEPVLGLSVGLKF